MTARSESSGPKSPAHRSFDSLEQQAFLNLWRTYDRLRMLEEELFSQHQLTPQQYNILRLLRGEHPGQLPTLALAKRLVSRAPDITRMLDKLAERELICRARPEYNRRTVFVGITPHGLQLLNRLDEPVRACHTQQLGHLKRAELRTLVELLESARSPHEDDTGPWSAES